MDREYSDWISPLQAEFGDALRMAAQYTEEEYEHLYVREDVRAEYTRGELEDLRHEKIALTLVKNRIETIAHAGECRCMSFQLEDAFVFLVPKRGTAGRVVSIDAEAAPDQSRLLDLCKF